MAFDISGRRLISGGTDGWLVIWNFSNGQILRKLRKESQLETSDINFIQIVM